MPPTVAAAAAPELDGTASEDFARDSGAAVLATPALVVRVFKGLGSAADGASLRQVCKQAAASLDWFDLMWCARADIPKVQAAINHHASVTIPTVRISRVVANSLSELWSCPPLLKWVVVQAAKQGDAELLGVVLGKQQEQQQECPSACATKARKEKLFSEAFSKHANMREMLKCPPVLQKIASSAGGDRGGCTIWLTVIAAEEAVHSCQLKLLEHMSQQAWFEQTPLGGAKAIGSMTHQNLEDFLDQPSQTSPKHQLGPAFLAAAAAGDVEAGKMLLNYCPELLDYTLWRTSPDRIHNSFVTHHPLLETPDFLLYGQASPFLDVLPLVSQLHRAGFTGIHLTDRVPYVLLHLCHHNQRHQPESVQMLLDLGLVSCDQKVNYEPSKDFRPKGFFETHCPIIAVAVAEQNAAAVAVLVAAGAVLPQPMKDVRTLPFDYSGLQAVVSDLDDQVAAAAGDGVTVIGAAQYQKAADVLRAYCEEHGREKINASALVKDRRRNVIFLRRHG
jgi:hypothetical protein